MAQTYTDQEFEELDDFAKRILNAMKDSDVDTLDPAIVSFTLVDVLSSYCVCKHIPINIVLDLLIDVHSENIRIANEQRSQQLQ